MENFKTEQEQFWAGDFGSDYAERNKSSQLLSSNIAMFSKIISYTRSVNSVIEFGANIGLNLLAIKQLLPAVELSAIEINQAAVNELKHIKDMNIYHQSILDFSPDHERDFVLIKGVLIHINPDELGRAYDLLYKSSKRYICIAEYYNPTPVGITYRGHKDKLFKRDFAGEMIDRYKDLRLIEYGFIYHRDSNFPQDDITWFLLEK
ncbi:MAG TPA: pseudaminic acid biosynthesis-associated methylase [Deltaproteobacteria bacterium]|nr:pseudaminic acid biosynthesis-associated methylase [Deltaproteobacteria bacterium]